MTHTSQTDLALSDLYTTWLRCQSPIANTRAIAAAILNQSISRLREQALNLPEYRAALDGATCYWSVRREYCYLVVLIRFIDRPLPVGLRDLALLEAVCTIALCNLGVQQVELVGSDWQGLRVMRDGDGWIEEAL